MASSDLPRPPYDTELVEPFSALAQLFPGMSDEILPALRQAPSEAVTVPALEARGFVITTQEVAGYDGGVVQVSTVAKPGRSHAGPGIFHTHGGGMILGDRWHGALAFADWIERDDAVLVTVDYRLAPEFPDPHPVEDSYSALLWTAEHAGGLGIDPARLFVAGQSAGGGLAAAMTLLARDRRGPELKGQILMTAMLDDRDQTLSTRQFDGTGGWDRAASVYAWNALLGDRRGTADVSPYAAPARAADLGGLPSAFIECTSTEIFRDENVAYAGGLWAAGTQAELHIWAGGFHGYDLVAPQSALVVETVRARDGWWRRQLAG